MNPRALFLSNRIYFDDSKKEGGVRLCTMEYLSLVQLLFETHLFFVQTRRDIRYRIKVKSGFNAYDDYDVDSYRFQLINLIKQQGITYVFLNLSNTVPFARIIKNEFGDTVKIILCSHGNESGDYLHEVVKHRGKVPLYKRLISTYTLGKLLKSEARFRQVFLDLVLTVSPVEEAIEKWIGAKDVFMVPRTIKSNPLPWNPSNGRIGFIGDLSHWPNYYGLDELCKHLSNTDNKHIELRLVGSPTDTGKKLAEKYSFVNYLGYLPAKDLEQEACTWCFFLNPVFYYSRGVSTKLAKAISWGIPVISTTIGCRGYVWKEGGVVLAENASSMAGCIIDYANDSDYIRKAKEQIDLLGKSGLSLEEIATNLKKII